MATKCLHVFGQRNEDVMFLTFCYTRVTYISHIDSSIFLCECWLRPATCTDNTHGCYIPAPGLCPFFSFISANTSAYCSSTLRPNCRVLGLPAAETSIKYQHNRPSHYQWLHTPPTAALNSASYLTINDSIHPLLQHSTALHISLSMTPYTPYCSTQQCFIRACSNGWLCGDTCAFTSSTSF